MTFDLIATLTLGVGTLIMRATHLLILFYLSVTFHQICFGSLCDIAETRFVTYGRTDGAILIYHQKFLRGHKTYKNIQKMEIYFNLNNVNDSNDVI